MRREWTKEEEKILFESYAIVGPKKLGESLNRTMTSVVSRASKLGLRRGVAASNHDRRNIWKFTEWSYDLGYIVGVYLGDGNIHINQHCGYFRLGVIDKDFCEATISKLKKITGYNSSLKQYPPKPPGKYPQWLLTFSNRDFVRWLEKNFGGPKKKRISVLPTLEANKGMVEGLFDSEGTVLQYSSTIRMQDPMSPLKWILFEQLGIVRGFHNKGGHKLKYHNLYSLSVSNKEYTRVGLGTYIKRKAKHGIVYKQDSLTSNS